ncbi:hypothetical protein F3Y22_tig00110634pilonHSYRG00019 [Hibiscus syriacus]|uniref:Uncharacterized protein n=1 Tax=Hibiscus syriacus TaxID=106335 RepID=A0A6A3A113_HIBSY|nr:hypothetical protein F3Y22_tig00110634pilonHSYRG00019 [Hibiscus syriacus]
MEEDDIYTKDGTVDYKGNPPDKKKTGTWKTCPYIIGRYWTIACFSIIYIIGRTRISLSASVHGMKPRCYAKDNCDPTETQSSMTFLALYLIALGIGGIKPCVSSQTNKSWGWGFGIPAIAMAITVCFFFSGTRLYIGTKYQEAARSCVSVRFFDKAAANRGLGESMESFHSHTGRGAESHNSVASDMGLRDHLFDSLQPDGQLIHVASIRSNHRPNGKKIYKPQKWPNSTSTDGYQTLHIDIRHGNSGHPRARKAEIRERTQLLLRKGNATDDILASSTEIK